MKLGPVECKVILRVGDLETQIVREFETEDEIFNPGLLKHMAAQAEKSLRRFRFEQGKVPAEA